MAVSFTVQEKQIIKEKLQQVAKQYAALVGIRKTTVDQLVEAADISKGMFYKLYPSKEMLFFEMLEEMHTKAYDAADAVLRTSCTEPNAVRMGNALSAACQVMDSSGMMEIIEKDIDYLLRKIPQEISETHYHDDSVHIRNLLEGNGITANCGTEIASDTIRAIFLTITHKKEIGNHYDAVLNNLIDGTCQKIFL